MKKTIFIVLLFLITPKVSFSNEQSVRCNQFKIVIENEMKEMSYVLAQGSMDDSAVRETVRAIRINNCLQLINIHLKLLECNKCKPFDRPIFEAAYMMDAMSCILEEKMGKKDCEACKREKWKNIATDILK